MKVSVAEYNISNLDEEVILSGWISKKRNLGGLFFIDLRDRSGIIQLNINNECKDYELVSKLSIKKEQVIKIIIAIIKKINIIINKYRNLIR